MVTTLAEALAGWTQRNVLGGPAIPVIPCGCAECGKPIALKWASITGRCNDCHGGTKPWQAGPSSIWSLTVYVPEVGEFPGTQVVLASKKNLGLARAMMALAAAVSPYSAEQASWKPTLIIPCPSHKGRENPRSAALGAGAFDALGVPSQDVLRRVDDNPPRSTTKGKEHPRDVEDMVSQMEIECSAAFTGQERILLVDDIVTHGVTLGNCGLVLKEKGAVEIRAITFARTRTPKALSYIYEQDSTEDAA